MTTAGRPTWEATKGGNENGGTRSLAFAISQKYSSRDLAAHNTLKLRKEGQDTKEELQKRNLRKELDEREFIRDDRKSALPSLLFSDDHDVDDEDDTEALKAEVERMKKERAKKKLRQQEHLQELKPEEDDHLILSGNPLLKIPINHFNVKRRWDDDVVFKNLKDRGETKVPKRFVNDTIRNEFHRKFQQKYFMK